MTEVAGAVIVAGVEDWQIFQQDADGVADIEVSGRWGGVSGGTVELRLVHEDTAALVARHLDWQPAVTRADGTWSAVLKRVPAGGLYRLETHLRPAADQPAEWAARGDLRHFLGVGDLWIIAGQSNSAGYGRGPCYDPPELGIHLFNNAMRWALATQPLNESTGTVHPENCEGGNSGHGPWLHFARLIRRRMHIPVGLAQVSLGGSPLVSWNPAEPGAHPLFELMMRVHRAVGGRVRGVLWHQGCSDADPKLAPTYEDRFVAAVAAWREAMRQPELPVVTVQLNRWMDSASDDALQRAWTILRDAQRRVPERLKHVAVVSALDLSLTDGIHISPGGNMLIGERAAASALDMVYGQPVYGRAPQPERARFGREGTAIELSFRDVAGRMDTIDARAIPFRVEDEQGEVPVTKVEYTGTAMIRLLLGRTVAGRAVVHGAFGACPPPAPADMDRVVPMLGFYGFPVQ